MTVVRVVVDCRIESPNRLMREHFRSRARRRRMEAYETALTLKPLTPPRLPEPGEPPIVVTFTRLASQLCDDDNLAAAFKVPRDAVAAWLGCADSPKDGRVVWRYTQRKRRVLAPPSRRPRHKWMVWFGITIATGVPPCPACGAIGAGSLPRTIGDGSDRSPMHEVQP